MLWNEIDFSSIGFSAKQKESIEASINTIVKLKSHSFVANSLDYWVTDKSSSSDETKNIYKVMIVRVIIFLKLAADFSENTKLIQNVLF